jgi:hypothetical protein
MLRAGQVITHRSPFVSLLLPIQLADHTVMPTALHNDSLIDAAANIFEAGQAAPVH